MGTRCTLEGYRAERKDRKGLWGLGGGGWGGLFLKESKIMNGGGEREREGERDVRPAVLNTCVFASPSEGQVGAGAYGFSHAGCLSLFLSSSLALSCQWAAHKEEALLPPFLCSPFFPFPTHSHTSYFFLLPLLPGCELRFSLSLFLLFSHSPLS